MRLSGNGSKKSSGDLRPPLRFLRETLQPAKTFSLQSAAVAGEGAVFPDYSVAGDDYGNGILPVRQTDRADGFRIVNGSSLFAVAAGLAERNF